MGRPTKFKQEYIEQAEKLCKLGATDIGVADFFEVSLTDIAHWAWERKEFYDAITPTIDRRQQWEREKVEAKERIYARKRDRLSRSPAARIRNAISARLWAAIKGRSDGRLFSRLGYSPEDLMYHLEVRFEPGMTWENYGSWHVDHKKPCALFDLTDQDQFGKCWALDNLQPLWAADNIKKGATYAGS